ncbi:MAG TPA: hypothetical protein VFQ77_18650 [Pseudonocardiaceae bacterium]|jgi:hypothetical protein|nr:hypothetical protein [Pseudonocardiaceae bacterium]
MYEFAVDALADPALAEEVADISIDRLRAACRQAGQELCYNMLCLNQDLQQLQSGDLIRIVLHGPKGAIICNRVIPGEYIVTLTRDSSAAYRPELPLPQVQAVQDADRVAADIVDHMRDAVSLGTQNPGGWSTSRPTGDTSTVNDVAPGLSQPVVVEVAGQQDHPLRETCHGALSTTDLHYVAYIHHEHESGISADCLEDSALSRFFLLTTGAARRKIYHDLGRQFPVVARQLFQAVYPVIGGPLPRIVLDVEQGALYFYRLSAEDHLLGVTLNQRRVSHTDDKMARLARTAQMELGYATSLDS